MVGVGIVSGADGTEGDIGARRGRGPVVGQSAIWRQADKSPAPFPSPHDLLLGCPLWLAGAKAVQAVMFLPRMSRFVSASQRSSAAMRFIA
jgi:hypothetical protein